MVDVTESCDPPDELQPLPPTRNHVYRTLRDLDAPATRAYLCEATGLSERTVERALGDLTDAGLVESRPHPTDARRKSYTTK